MAISLSNEAKTKVSLSLETKSNNLTLDEADWTLDEANPDSTLDVPKLVLSKETKSSINLSLESK